MNRNNISVVLAALLSLSLLCTGCDTSQPSAPKDTPAESQVAQTEEAADETEAAAETEAPTEAPAPESTEAVETTATEAAAPADQTVQESWKLIQKNGFREGECDQKTVDYSNLSFFLKSDTLQDLGDCWSVEAEFQKAVHVPGGLQEGDSVTFTINELTGAKVTATLKGDELVNDEDEGDVYYYYFHEGSEDVVLTQFSDDVVSCPFYNGKLLIRKDATLGIAIMNDYHAVKEKDLKNDPWFNGVAFDSDGLATALVFFGD